MDKKFAERLLKVTAFCRPDMHEPDEQDITAVITGTHLDNACGSNPITNRDEYTVGIADNKGVHWFNLATLIAFARIGAAEVLAHEEQY